MVQRMVRLPQYFKLEYVFGVWSIERKNIKLWKGLGAKNEEGRNEEDRDEEGGNKF